MPEAASAAPAGGEGIVFVGRCRAAPAAVPANPPPRRRPGRRHWRRSAPRPETARRVSSSRRSAAPKIGNSRLTSPPRLPGNTVSTSSSAAMPCAARKRSRIAALGAAFEHRMADIAGGQTDPLEIGRLERQQGQQMVVPARHAAGAAGPPGPDHRRDVVNERQGLAFAAQPVRHPPAEAGAVDRHDGVGPQRRGSPRRSRAPGAGSAAPAAKPRRPRRPRDRSAAQGSRPPAPPCARRRCRRPAAGRRCARATPRSAPRRARRPTARRR